ncbi:MAG: 3-hydroxyacyl-ACP dehydratase FabZ [Verrucomicrobia bacterium]|nr:3-hydroxyacyl-ACP dehydratase FabZ [Verrucomicrobiota bacterium]
MTDSNPLDLLPHRAPFVFVDRIVELEPGLRAVGVKKIAADEWYLRGHFPGNPLVPGVILVEALAQVAGIALNSEQHKVCRRTYLSAIRSMKFLRPVLPDEEITLVAQRRAQLGNLTQFAVAASVNGTAAAEGEVVLGWVS